jgi:hypothetical protein
MKNITVVLAVAFVSTLGASSVAQAALIDFGVTALGGTITFAGGGTLDMASSVDLDGSKLIVSNLGPGDDSGLSVFPGGADNTVKISPTDIMFGSMSGDVGKPLIGGPIEKTWLSGTDVFTETLTTVKSIDRDTVNAITVTLTGKLTDTNHIFFDTPASLILSVNEARGPTGVVSASLTNEASTAIPEPSTWVMMALGFLGLGYAASRGRKTNIAMLSA